VGRPSATTKVFIIIRAFAMYNVKLFFNQFSPSIMKSVLAADMEGFTPEGIMKKAVMSDRYSI